MGDNPCQFSSLNIAVLVLIDAAFTAAGQQHRGLKAKNAYIKLQIQCS
jgi:hypothetical protein